ncbi:MAG: helix-turn-helix domain-containing protein [Clostridia bacterium]|nr:helix-turn-helix domain-containing protein [Clostridia bacterium]
MIKVLLLDDEKLALEYLETIVDWPRHGFTIIGCLTDAKQALKVFRRERPELIISDICMVGMDGIDFASFVRNIDQGVHILFLSGYKNFEYVQSAIRLGIDDYLLKSDISSEIFLDKLMKIKEKIERERQKIRYTGNAVFREIFEDGVDEKAYKDILNAAEYARLHKRYHYLITSIKHCPPFIAHLLPGLDENCYIDDEGVGMHIAAAAEQEGMVAAASFKLDDVRMLTALDASSDFASEHGQQKNLYQSIQRIFQRLNGPGSMRYDLFYTRERFTMREFGRLYFQGRTLLNRGFLHGNPHIYEFCRAAASPNTAADKSRFSRDRLFRAIEKGDRSFLEEYIQNLHAAITHEDCNCYLKLLRMSFETFAFIEEEYAQGAGSQYFNAAEASANYDFSKPDDIARYVSHKLDEAFHLYQGDLKTAHSKSIQMAIAFLQENYSMEELGIGMVAKRVNLSPSWLSAKFKEEMGMGISEFLNSIRIQHAREMLRNGDYMIYEVSEKTGFASSQYFSKIFKQFTGMTPNEYRRKSKNTQRK